MKFKFVILFFMFTLAASLVVNAQGKQKQTDTTINADTTKAKPTRVDAEVRRLNEVTISGKKGIC